MVLLLLASRSKIILSDSNNKGLRTLNLDTKTVVQIYFSAASKTKNFYNIFSNFFKRRDLRFHQDLIL
jgi:hypothetical protein